MLKNDLFLFFFLISLKIEWDFRLKRLFLVRNQPKFNKKLQFKKRKINTKNCLNLIYCDKIKKFKQFLMILFSYLQKISKVLSY